MRISDWSSDVCSSDLLLSLINDLLDLSKIEAGKLELWEEEVDLGSLIERCRVFIEEQAHNKGLTLTLRTTAELPGLRCDARKMKQVLVNLLSNAVKFTPSGGRILLEASVIGTAGAPGAPGVEGAEGVVIQVSRSKAHTSELQSLLRISYAVFCL